MGWGLISSANLGSASRDRIVPGMWAWSWDDLLLWWIYRRWTSKINPQLIAKQFGRWTKFGAYAKLMTVNLAVLVCNQISVFGFFNSFSSFLHLSAVVVVLVVGVGVVSSSLQANPNDSVIYKQISLFSLPSSSNRSHWDRSEGLWSISRDWFGKRQTEYLHLPPPPRHHHWFICSLTEDHSSSVLFVCAIQNLSRPSRIWTRPLTISTDELPKRDISIHSLNNRIIIIIAQKHFH